MPIASLTAIEVLRAGGNAVDAAVAACAVLAVVEPQSTGLGGDCFCLYAPPGGKVVAVNGSGRSAGAASLDAIRAAGSTPPDDISPHGVTIPGAVSGWQLLLDAHGTKGFDELLVPAIRCAEEGFPVHQRVAWDWSMYESKLRRAGNTLFLPGGRPPREGDRFVQTALAEHAARDRQARRGRFLQGAGRSRHGGDASCARRRADGRGFRQRTERRRVRRADLASNGAASTSGSVRPTGRVWSRS